MKINNSLLTLLLVALIGLTFGSSAKAQRPSTGSLLGIIQEISTLANEFNLTAQQKSVMRSILMSYLPGMALKANTMANNRQDLMDITLGQNMIDENAVLEIAEKQGQLLTSIIVTKERLKKDIRGILTVDQKDLVDELITTIIQHRLNR